MVILPEAKMKWLITLLSVSLVACGRPLTTGMIRPDTRITSRSGI